MTTWYRRHPDLRLTALEGEGVVLQLGSRRYFTVNEVGVDILEALREPRTLDQLVSEIMHHYAVGEERAAKSVRNFLERCAGTALVLAEER
ncbi:MAG TPA: PqqD family protein [Gemmatimonadales bacterium]|nr:PqqD family protein [Gemmatimonadales bacterium]